MKKDTEDKMISVLTLIEGLIKGVMIGIGFLVLLFMAFFLWALFKGSVV